MATIRLDDDHFLYDRKLSWKARGLLAFILSHKKGWEINIQTLIDESEEDGRVAVQSGFQELIKAKYVKLETVRDKHGRVRGKTYVVNRTPSITTDEQETCPSEPTSRKTDNHETCPLVTNKHENRQTENMLVGENGANTSDNRQTEKQVSSSSVEQLAVPPSPLDPLTPERQEEQNRDLSPPTPSTTQAKGVSKGKKREGSGRIVIAKAKAILDYFNLVHGREYESTEQIETLLRSPSLQEPSLEDCKLVIDYLYHIERFENPEGYAKYVNVTSPFRPGNFDRHRGNARQWNRAGRPPWASIAHERSIHVPTNKAEARAAYNREQNRLALEETVQRETTGCGAFLQRLGGTRDDV